MDAGREGEDLKIKVMMSKAWSGDNHAHFGSCACFQDDDTAALMEAVEKHELRDHTRN